MLKNKDLPVYPIINEEQAIAINEGQGLAKQFSGLTKREEFALRFATALLSNSVMGDSDLHGSAEEYKTNIVVAGIEFADVLLEYLERKSD